MRISPRITGRRPLVAAATALAVVGGTGTALAVRGTGTALAVRGAGTALAVGTLGDADRSAEPATAIDTRKPRNVILLIGDGTDDSILTASRNYRYGAAGRLPALDALPFTGDMTTYGLKVGAGPDYPIAYVSDSAPTASGWSTGRKTVDGRVSQGPSTASDVPGEDYETALEILKAQGKRVGNVTTSALTDATPAAAGAHVNLRECQGPANMANCASARKVNGGKGSIAEQLVGFFLQVESAMVDKREDASDACGAIGDVLQLDEATQAALDYQAAHPDTLIIVTGDHGHSTQIVPNSTSSGRFTTTLRTADGDPMTLAYSTATSTGGSMAHTGTQIRVAVKGPQAANVTGLIDQTDIFQSLLGREPSELPKHTETVTTTVTTPATTVTTPARTVTAPARTVTTPAAPVAPRVAVTAASRIRRPALKAQGLPVAVAASDARTVTVELRRGRQRLVRRTVKANGGTTTLKAAARRGALRVVVTARGAGGTRTAARTVRVR